MIAPWPERDPRWEDPQIEVRFARFQEVLRAVREIRSRQNVPPKRQIEFSVRCEADTAELLRPMEPYFVSMAASRPTAWGAEVAAPALSANVTLPGIDVFVDLAELIDLEAEIDKKRQEIAKLDRLIAAKQKKLENKKFLERAPAAVVQQERDGLAELGEQHATTSQVLESCLTLQLRNRTEGD